MTGFWLQAQVGTGLEIRMYLYLYVIENGDSQWSLKMVEIPAGLVSLQSIVTEAIPTYAQTSQSQKGNASCVSQLEVLRYSSYDRLSYDMLSYDRLSYDRLSYDVLSYDRLSYDRLSCDRRSYGRLSYDMLSYDRLSYDRLSYDRLSYDRLSYDRLSYDMLSYDGLSYDRLSYNRLSYDMLSYDRLSYDRLSYDRLSDDLLIYRILSYATLHILTQGSQFSCLCSCQCSVTYLIMFSDWTMSCQPGHHMAVTVSEQRWKYRWASYKLVNLMSFIFGFWGLNHSIFYNVSLQGLCISLVAMLAWVPHVSVCRDCVSV